MSDKNKSSSGISTLLLLGFGVAALWVFCTAIIFLAFPNWETRGTVGDSFGAVNALFSGLAFAGVIYSLWLQRRELGYQRDDSKITRALFESQLRQMRTATELQAQPIAIPQLLRFRVERPRLFYSPPTEEHSAQSRYVFDVALKNPSSHSALAVNIRARLLLSESNVEQFSMVDQFLEIVPPNSAVTDEFECPDFMIVQDYEGHLFDSLRQNDPRRLPVIVITVLFKNIVGGHFQLTQAFNLYAKAEQMEVLRSWHTAIVGFETRFREQIKRLIELKKKDDVRWQSLFDSVKQEFQDSLGESLHEELRAQPIPGNFDFKHVDKAKFDQDMSSASYPRLIVEGLHDCPAELDRRSE